MANPWEMNWEGGAATATDTPPWEQSYTDAAPAPRSDVPQLRSAQPKPMLSRALEATREFLAPVLGPTEAMKLRDAVPWTDEAGNQAYVYKPLGSKVDQEGLVGALSHPAVAVPRFKHNADDGNVEAVAKAMANTGAGFVEFIESPMGLMTGGAANVVPRLVAGAFAGDMGLKAPEALSNFQQVTQDPKASFGDKVETTLGTAVNLALPIGLTKAATGKTKPANAEAAKLETELKATAESVKSPAPELKDAPSNPLADTRIEPIPAAVTDAALREAPATVESGGSPVERFIAEQKARGNVVAKPEPKPWEMEYAGGEMPAGTAWPVAESPAKAKPQMAQMDANPTEAKLPAPVDMPDAVTIGTLPTQSEVTAAQMDANPIEAKPVETQKTTEAQRKAGKVELKIPGYMNNPPETVSGSLVKLKADASNEYVAIQRGANSWMVVERTTGLRPGETYAKTKSAAVAMAEANIVKAGGAERMKQLVESSTKLNEQPKPVEAPGQAVAKVQEHVAAVAAGEKPMAKGSKADPVKPAATTAAEPIAPKRAAKEIKSELVQRLEEALADAPAAADVDAKYATTAKGKRYQTQPASIGKITIEIPGDGKFTLVNTKEALAITLAKAKKLNTSSNPPQSAPVGTLQKRPGFIVEGNKRVSKTGRLEDKELSAVDNATKQLQAGQTLEGWADEVLSRDPRSKTRAGLDPIEEAQRLAAVAIKGSYIVARGVRDFAAWSAEMIKQLPELANATAEQLKALYSRSVDIAEGRDPEIGLSIRGMKVKADTKLSDEVTQNTEAAYLKRVSADDVAEAKRLLEAAGGPEAAAGEMLQGLWKTVDMPVQVKAMGEMMDGLARLERHATEAGNTARANDLADLQVRVADHSRRMATTPAQWLQAFSSLYANYSPAAWLKEWRNAVNEGRRTRIENATGRKGRDTESGQARDIAEGVADGIANDAPTVAEAIRQAFGGETDKANKPLVEVVQEIFKQKPEQARKTAKKIQDFYEREVEKFKRKHKIPELTPEDQRKILAEAKALEKLPKDSLQRREAVLKLLDSLHRRKGFEWWELPVAFWYANTLSGPTTHAKNIFGNSINLGMEAGLQTLLKPTSLPVILESLGRSLSVGAREAASIIKTGHDTAARHGDKFELRRNPMELQTGALNKILLPWKLVGRILRAEDAVFFNAGQELRAAILAKHKAGGDTAAMLQAMGWTPEARAKAEAQATAEGLTGWNYQRRVNEIIEQGRSNELMNAARDFGYYVTFDNDPYGVLGAFTSAINRGFEFAPMLKPFILPFTRIVANVTNSSLNWTPVGTYRALRAQRKLNWLGRAENSGKLYGREINDPLAIRDAHARALVGTAAVVGLTAAAIKNVFDEDPEFMVTGAGPANKDQRDALKASGWIPYSVKIGSRYYSYQDKPPQVALSIIGHYLDAVRYKNLDREDALNRTAYALNGSWSVLLNSSWLQGVSSMFNQVNRDSVKGGLTSGVVAQGIKSGSGFVVPSALKQLDRFFDPNQYSPQDVQGMLLAQIPWARRNGHPDLNIFGQPVSAPTSKIFWSKVEGDKLTQALAGQRVFPGMPNQGELTPEEHYKLVQYRGPILRELLIDNMENWMGAPRLLAQDEVNRVSARATEQAKRDLGLDEVNKERRDVRKMTTK